MTIGVAIPAYSDPERLRRGLQSVRQHAPDCPITVVDDSGTGKITAALRAEFLAVRWIIHETNRGFGQSASDAVTQCEADIVILLNDDVELLSDPRAPLLTAFSDPALFAATFRSQDTNGRFREGAKRLVWPCGMPRILHNERDQRPARNGILFSDYAVGGHAAYHREKFRALSGFDALFDPFYWEDVDLCVRARKRGWKTLYLPACEVRHDEHGAIRSSFAAARIREITQRNRLLFAWRHMPRAVWPLHLIALGWELLASVCSRERTLLHAFSAARNKYRTP